MDFGRLAGAGGFQGCQDCRTDVPSIASAQHGGLCSIDHTGKVLSEEVVVFIGNALVLELQGGLIPVVAGDLRARFGDDGRSAISNQVQLDLPNVRVCGGTDAADTQRCHNPVLHFKGHGREVIHVVVSMGLVKVGGRAGHDSSHLSPASE